MPATSAQVKNPQSLESFASKFSLMVGHMSDAQWWRSAVIYQVYPRSFADFDGNGVGDLPGITSRLAEIRDLGADAIWLSPFMTSPQNDAGYDVADYCDVDPLFGTLADFDAMTARARELDLRVIIDLVPNHSSSEHEWFKAALAAGPGSPERARYLFRDAPEGELPNNWSSVFGGPAWTQVDDGQWYLHLFDSTQPDLDWRNPEVPEMFEDVLDGPAVRGWFPRAERRRDTLDSGKQQGSIGSQHFAHGSQR